MNNLADRYAYIKDEIDALTKQLESVRAEIKATGREEIVGDYAIVKVCLSERTTFDAKLAQTFLSDNQLAACERVTLVETLRVKPRLPSVVA
jgi:hypothetical protein